MAEREASRRPLACTRCGEPLVEPAWHCGWCREELKIERAKARSASTQPVPQPSIGGSNG
jgi:hypothetical protein